MQLRLELRVQEASKDGHALNFAFSGIPVGSRWTLGAGQERLAQEVQRALEVPHVGCPFFFGTSANCQKHKASAATDWTFHIIASAATDWTFHIIAYPFQLEICWMGFWKLIHFYGFHSPWMNIIKILRLSLPVGRALSLQVGQCAVDLSNAFLLLDLDKLERLYSKAKAQSSAGSELKFDLQVSCWIDWRHAECRIQSGMQDTTWKI